MKCFYRTTDKFDFGWFNGFEVGVVYLICSRYLEWAILNIPNFCIADFDNLIQTPVFESQVDWQNLAYITPDECFDENMVKEYHRFIETYGTGTRSNCISDTAVKLNKSKLHRFNTL